MNADEVVRIDEAVKALHRLSVLLVTPDSIVCCEAADLIESLQAQTKVTGETSDGYHTFNELYHHRAVLFSVICNDRPNVSWKSKLHHDGTMFDGMFIVGIQTHEGQATYHYDIDPYWDMFRVPELPQAPEWDGHTSEQAIERIGNLPSMHTNLSTSQRRADAAVEDITHGCDTCIRCQDCEAGTEPECAHCYGNVDAWNTYEDSWDWRGQGAGKGEEQCSQ